MRAQHTVFSQQCLNFAPKFDLAVPMPGGLCERGQPVANRAAPARQQLQPDGTAAGAQSLLPPPGLPAYPPQMTGTSILNSFYPVIICFLYL